MNADELLVRLALNYGQTKAPIPRAALLVNVGGPPSDWRVTHKALSDGRPTTPPPVAKILTTRAKALEADQFLGDYCLALNYAPTDWCLGLAWLLKVKYVVYHTPDGVKARKTNTDDVEADGFPLWNLSKWTWDCVYGATKTFVYLGKDERAKRGNREKIEPIVNSLTTAEVIDKIDFAGVRRSPLPVVAAAFGAMPGNPFREDLYLRTAFALVNKTWKRGGRPEGLAGHNIGAIAVGADDKIVAWAVNVSEVSRCFHAESLVVFDMMARNLSTAKLRLYATLEPCQMCSGMITTLCPGATIVYGMADPKIKNSSLARGKNDCRQRLATTHADSEETIPALLARLKQESAFGGNVTGFLDHKKDARPAFQGARDTLARTPGAIDRFNAKVANRLATVNQDPEARRRAMALLDVRSRAPNSNLDPHMNALDLAAPPQQSQLQSVGPDYRAHLPLIEYLDRFLTSVALAT